MTRRRRRRAFNVREKRSEGRVRPRRPVALFLDPRKRRPSRGRSRSRRCERCATRTSWTFTPPFQWWWKKDESGGPPPKDGGVRREWARLLGAGWLDAAARPAAAAAVAGAAWECAVWAPGGSKRRRDEGGGVRRVGPVRPEVLVCAPRRRPTATATRHRPVSHRPVSHRPFPRTNWRTRISRIPLRRRPVRSAPRPVVERVARLERTGRLDRRSRPEVGGAGSTGTREGRSRQGKGDEKDRRAQRDAGRVAASADPLLHRLLNTAPRRLRTMPWLDGAAKGTAGDVGNRCIFPRGLARTSSSFDPRRAAPTISTISTIDDDAAGDERISWKPGRRAMEVNAELRDVAEAHRAPSSPRRTQLRDRPARTGGNRDGGQVGGRDTSDEGEPSLLRSRTSRNTAAIAATGRRRVRRAGLHGDAAGRRVDARREEQRGDGALSLAVLHADFFEGGISSFSYPGGDDAGDGFEPTGGIAESATDAILDALTRGAMDGAERGAFMAYAAASSRCHAADQSRRRKCAEYLWRRVRGGRGLRYQRCEDLGAVASRGRRRRRWVFPAGRWQGRGDVRRAGSRGVEDGNAREVPGRSN